LTILFTETSATRLHALQSEPGISSFQYLLTQTRVMVTYIRLIFLPLNQNIYYDYSVSKNFFELPVLSSLLFIMTVLYFAKSLFLKYRILSVSIFWFFLTLLPESSFLPIKDVIFEHRLYLPLAGYCMFLVSGMYYLLGKNTIKTMVVALMMVIAWNSFLTYQRNKVWLDEFSLWEDSVQKSPHIAGPYNGLGLAYLQQGDLTRALADFNKAIELDPKNAETYNNRGNIYSDQGKFNEAISDFNNSIGLNPDEARAYNNRGIAYSRMGKFTEALSDYNKAIKVDPELAWIYYDRAILYTDQGKLSQALSDYNLVLRIDPGIANAYINRGIIFDDTGNLAQARADYNTAIKINPGIAEAYLDRGNTYRQQGDLIPALLDYNNAIAINVKYSDAYYQRALIYYQLKEYDKAWEDANKAKELGVFVNPDFKSLLWQIKNR
jgi:tetratricopeptide (TPR) repeat protein